MRRLAAFPALLFLALSCSPAGPAAAARDGAQALADGDHARAAKTLASALRNLEPTSPAALKARLERCRALAHVDPPLARTEFFALLDTGRVQYGHISILTEDLTDAGEYDTAIEILEASYRKLPAEERLNELRDRVGLLAEAQGIDTSMLDRLRDLGYLGNDNGR